MIYFDLLLVDHVVPRRLVRIFSTACFFLLPFLISGCCSSPQTYPTSYGNQFPGAMPGTPVNSGYYAPPVINPANPGMPLGYTAGTVPPTLGGQPGQPFPYNNVVPPGATLPQYSAPAGGFPPGYPPPGFPGTGYPPGVPLNTMAPSQQPLFGR